ncbi:hypothetical protein PIB30_038868 [Stylosanthes scabra]|uniref:Uncharacterized protein n=1 Tax=Stylosanthes scabra TaxID=79078 RepID=A0ABU6WC99_9FABA|nr:hypothetical protein [Stylosanthes scabra]
MSRRFSQIVVRVYSNGVSTEGPNGVEFHSPDPVIFMMWSIETLSDPKKIGVLAKQRRACPSNVRKPWEDPNRSSDGSLLQILDTQTATLGAGPSDPAPKVEAPMTANSVDVVPPHERAGETESSEEDLGDTDGGNFGSGDDEFVSITPIGTRFLLPALLPVPDFSTVDNHFHTLNLDAIEEDRMTDIGG